MARSFAGSKGAFDPARVVGLDPDRLAAFAARQLGALPDGIQLTVQPLRGGLEAVAVARVTGSVHDAGGRVLRSTFVVKRLDGSEAREATLYARVLERAGLSFAPRFLGSELIQPDVTYLYLEYVRASTTWPWRDAAVSAEVLTRLAGVHHALAPASVDAVLGWEYEADLHDSAEATFDAFERVTRHESLAALRPARGALRRITAALAAMRRALLEAEPFGATVLHGDLHSGNVIVRGGNAVLLDWGRSRVGSALEDVSSWLQSLGYWEPEAMRRHDTLFRHYLAARGLPSELRRSVRDAYWLAAASNTLAGALRYHLLLADGWGLVPSRTCAEAARAARDHLRVIRRADEVWRS